MNTETISLQGFNRSKSTFYSINAQYISIYISQICALQFITTLHRTTNDRSEILVHNWRFQVGKEQENFQ
jgi:hypothetical protein